MNFKKNNIKIVLASSSINRKELLGRLGFSFTTISPDVDETPLPQETPVTTAQRLASIKTEKVAQALWNEARQKKIDSPQTWVIIGSDQVSYRHRTFFDKPLTRERAVAQLLEMQGREVLFYTALCVMKVEFAPVANEDIHMTTIVNKTGGSLTRTIFRSLTQAQIEDYVDRDQPLQCAGSAKCESLGIALLRQVDSSDPTALIGLPLILLTDFLEHCGLSPLNG